MTRKEALNEAIKIIRTTKIDQEKRGLIIKKLELCVSELPFTSWSEEAIFDACEEFIRENGRGITTKDFERPELPSHPAIKNRFGMTAKEFRDLYYPLKETSPKSRYANHPVSYWTEQFISEYNRIRPMGQREYDQKRDPNYPGWATIAKMNGVKTWSALQEKLGLKRYRLADRNIDYSFEFEIEEDDETP